MPRLINALHPRCVLDMGELSLSREGYTNYLGFQQELKVRLGDDVVVKCSVSSSEEPSYYWNKNVRTPRERAQWQRPHYALGNLSFDIPRSLPPLSVWPLYFFPPPGLFQVPLSLLALLKHSLNFLSSSNTSLFLSLTFSSHLFPPSSVVFPSPPLKKGSVFKWPVGLGTPLAGDCSLPTYRGLIV